MSENTFYLLLISTFFSFLLILAFTPNSKEDLLNKGYLSATKSFQVRCENDGFVVLNETLYRCSKVVEVPSVDLELGE